MEKTPTKTPRIQTLYCLVPLIGLFCMLGCSPSKPTAASTATNQVSGAFGFVLGEKFTAGPGWKKQEDGGYSYDTMDAEKPFDCVTVFADDQGRIYSITGNAVTSDSESLFESTKKLLAEKYPAMGKGLLGIEFGDAKREVELSVRNNVVKIDYTHSGLLSAFYDRTKKAKDADTRNALRGKL